MLYSQTIALLLNAFPLTGIFGGHYWYTGLTTLALLQTILSLTIIGIFITLPISYLSAFILILSILFGISNFMYPGVKFHPTTSLDRYIAYFIIGIYIGSIIFSLFR